MKVDLELLAGLLSQLEERPSISREGVNDYLLDQILFPCIKGADIRLDEIDFDAFQAEDAGELIDFYNRMNRQKAHLEELARNVGGIRPTAIRSRAYC